MVHPGRAWQHLAPDWKLVASVTGLKWADAPKYGSEKRKSYGGDGRVCRGKSLKKA